MFEDFYDRLQHLLNSKGINQVDAANGIGVSESRMSTLLKRGMVKNAPHIKTLTKMVDFFGCDFLWLKTGNGEPFPEPTRVNNSIDLNIGKTGNTGPVRGYFPSNQLKDIGLKERKSNISELQKIPVLGRVPAGIPNELGENVETYLTIPESPQNCYALKVKGESMEPGIKDGDYVLFVIDRDPVAGNVVIVNDEYGESMLKRLKIKDNEPFLVSDNSAYPTYQPNENYRIMGVVVGGWRPINL